MLNIAFFDIKPYLLTTIRDELVIIPTYVKLRMYLDTFVIWFGDVQSKKPLSELLLTLTELKQEKL